MRYLLWSVAGLVGLVLLMIVVGYLLPVAHVASRSAVVVSAPTEVFATISDVEHYPEWWGDVSRVEVLSRDPRLQFRQHSSDGPIVMEIVESIAPSRFVTRISDPDQPFGGTWTFELTPDSAGTRVTITERGEVYNPVFRFLSRFVFGHARTMERCLAALGSRHRRT